MLGKFKHTILRKKFDKSLLEYTQNRTPLSKEIQSVGILTTNEISLKLDLQKEIETQLNVSKTKLLSLREFNKLDEVSFTHFTKKDINWRGEFTQPSLQNFLEQPFDLLIGYFNTNNIYLKTAVLQSNATFKAGVAGVNSDLYELEISEDNDTHKYVKELKKYLQILKKLKN